jgi:hypothetical protein
MSNRAAICWTVLTRASYRSCAKADRGGAEGDLMELNGWPSPQMLRQRPQRPGPPHLRPHHAGPAVTRAMTR